jgi:alkylhydroperoxidase family enzyme
MNRLEPLPLDSLAELQDTFNSFKERMGFIANSGLIMARRPKILDALGQLAVAVFDKEESTVPYSLKSCMGQIASLTTGCLYCQAHFANNTLVSGVDAEKLKNLWSFEHSDLFSEEERSALRFAMAASQIPNGVTDEHFESLKKHWDDGQIVEMLGTLCYVAFLNRWNDSLATTLEGRPAKIAQEHLKGTGWEVGKHGSK